MYLKSLAAALLLAGAAPAFAESTIAIDGAYARVMGAMAKSGAAFMVIANHGDVDDRLIDAQSDVAQRTELHTHKAGADGSMQMLHVPEGFAIPAHDHHELMRGADHVMFMGLTRQVGPGDIINVTLTFEKAGDITVEIPVDNERQGTAGNHGHQHQHQHGG